MWINTPEIDVLKKTTAISEAIASVGSLTLIFSATVQKVVIVSFGVSTIFLRRNQVGIFNRGDLQQIDRARKTIKFGEIPIKKD